MIKYIVFLLLSFHMYFGFNITVEEDIVQSTSEPVVYKFDYNLFKNKSYKTQNHHFSSRKRRAISNRFLQDAQIESIEVKFSWGELIRGERLGSTFILRKGNKYIEYAMLYAPRDNTFTVRGLVDATGYIGEIRIIRDKEALSNTSVTDEQDTAIIKLDTARIVTGTETKAVLDTLANLPASSVKLKSVSISLKLPRQRENIVLEVFDLSKKENGGKAIVHIVPDTVSLVVNDLPPQTVVKIAVRAANGTPIKELSSLNLFTGSISILSDPKLQQNLQSTESRIVFNKPNIYMRRRTVTCYVDHKPPFQGYPCKDTNVCIPLHWECDGEEDCEGGFDEKGCQNGLSIYSQQNNNFNNNYNRNPINTNNNKGYSSGGQVSTQRCRRNEFECVSRGVSICLPVSWLCDGRTDCTDGWDEHKDNCRDSSNYHSNINNNNDNNNNYHNNYNIVASNCPWNYFKCRKGGCISLRFACDDRRDCADGSDEHDCPDDEDVDEEDGDNVSDNCDLEHEFTCERRKRSRRCVPRPWVCDDQDDCPFGEDEAEDICKQRYRN